MVFRSRMGLADRMVRRCQDVLLRWVQVNLAEPDEVLAWREERQKKGDDMEEDCHCQGLHVLREGIASGEFVVADCAVVAPFHLPQNAENPTEICSRLHEAVRK